MRIENFITSASFFRGYKLAISCSHLGDGHYSADIRKMRPVQMKSMCALQKIPFVFRQRSSDRLTIVRNGLVLN